jgi:hypothetical protein
MKSLTDHINEQLLIENEEEEKITSEKDFREWAHAKFEEVFGDDLDKERMKMTIDGFLDDNKELVEKEEWAELVGMFNASFSH